MRKNLLKKAMSGILAGTMLASMCAIPSAAAEVAYDGEIETVTLYPANANLQSGVVGGFRADILAKYGVELDVWAYSDEKTNAILASNTLPDVMYVTVDNLEVMIESGMILNLEGYLDQLTNVTDKEVLQPALNYVREYRSNGTGELYGIPTTVGNKVLEYGVTKNMTAVNWEYYSGIGCPPIKDQWELIDVMKQMMEAYPEGEDGVANFGTYLNAGSDTQFWANMQQYFKWFGYETTNLAYLLETNMVDATCTSILEDNSKYYEGLKWYNQVYLEGLMDPDSINSDRATQKAKVDNKHAMVPTGTVQGYSGYQPIFLEDQKLYQESWNSPYGSDYLLVVSSECDNVEAALRFINMLADPDAYLEFMSGPEGDLWYVEDGIAYMTEEAIETFKKGETWTLENGEELALWNTAWVITDTLLSSYMGPDGEYRGVRIDRWDESLEITYNIESMNEWRELTGYEFFVYQAIDNDAYTVDSELDYIANFTSVPDDMMQLTLDAIKDIVVNASWQMVYSQTEDEFNAIWDQMVQDCIDLGAQDIIDWRLADIEQAKEKRDALSAE
ncbi:MAG: hypothetical protein IJ468_15620 [Lachnospiraceae bacterium]|nr:hypothetical protein [Lachnospiraceae bacterium]